MTSALLRPLRLLAMILLAIVLTISPLSPVFAASLHSHWAKPGPPVAPYSAAGATPGT